MVSPIIQQLKVFLISLGDLCCVDMENGMSN